MGVVNTTYTFQPNDVITSSRMNDIIGQTTMTGTAILGNTLEVTTSGQLKVRAQNITSNELATNAVTETKITDGSVTPAKLSIGYPSWTTSGNLTVNGSSTALSSVSAGTASVSIGSARTASGASVIDFNSTFPLTAYEARISRDSGANGNMVISNTGTGSIVFNSTPLGAITGTAPIYGVRAWVNFDGQRNSSGGSDILNTNRFIRSSGNVSSVLRNGNGDYTITFTTALPNDGYSASMLTNDVSNGTQVICKIVATNVSSLPTLMTTTQVRIAANGYDPRTVCVNIVG